MSDFKPTEARGMLVQIKIVGELPAMNVIAFMGTPREKARKEARAAFFGTAAPVPAQLLFIHTDGWVEIWTPANVCE